MHWSKPLKILSFSALFLVLVIGLPLLCVTIKYIRADLRYGHSLRDPATKQLALTCALHKERTVSNTHQPPLAEPIYSDEKIIEWLTSTLPRVMSFNHATIQQQIQVDEQFFTPDGWCSFIDALADSNVVDATISRNFDTRMVLRSTPTIKKSNVNKDGVYTWYVEMPVSIAFRSDIAGATAPPDLTDETLFVVLERSVAQTNADGIGIGQWITVGVK